MTGKAPMRRVARIDNAARIGMSASQVITSELARRVSRWAMSIGLSLSLFPRPLECHEIVRLASVPPLPAACHRPICLEMTKPSPLDDPTSAAFAWARWKRMMRLMCAITGVTVVAILLYLWLAGPPVPIHFYIATGLGVGASMLLMAALMGLVFM